MDPNPQSDISKYMSTVFLKLESFILYYLFRRRIDRMAPFDHHSINHDLLN